MRAPKMNKKEKKLREAKMNKSEEFARVDLSEMSTASGTSFSTRCPHCGKRINGWLFRQDRTTALLSLHKK